MYMPPQFNSPNRAHACELMQSHPFASLISIGPDGAPFVTHLPLQLEIDPDGQDLRLLGHLARANPHRALMQTRPANDAASKALNEQGHEAGKGGVTGETKAKALVTFMGPQAYMTPRVYPDLVRVPTWNYLAVHCQVDVKLIEDADGKDRLLKKLIGVHDPAYVQQWIGLGPDYQHKMLGGIVAFELKVTDLQCKLKLNQHRPEAHAKMRAAYAAGGENEQALGHWMDKLGLNPRESLGQSSGLT